MSRWRDFLMLSAVVTMWWAAAGLPRVGMADHRGESWGAGWPFKFETWVVRPDEVESGHRFSAGAAALDVAAWLAALAAL